MSVTIYRQKGNWTRRTVFGEKREKAEDRHVRNALVFPKPVRCDLHRGAEIEEESKKKKNKKASGEG